MITHILLRAGRPEFDSRQEKGIFSSPPHPNRPWGPHHPAIQWVLGALSPRVKRPGREADHSLLCIKKGKKVKLSLCLTKHNAMKAYWEWRYSSTHSLTLALDGGEWSASRPGRFTPKGK
jgi:hypothetical protein